MPKTCLAADKAGNSDRLARLVRASPVYARLVENDPALVTWLEETAEMPTLSLRTEWCKGAPAPPGAEMAPQARLRAFRRRMSLRIAYRSVNDLASERETTAELTRLAEFCVREATAHALALWRGRRGEPWDEDLNRPARFAVLALGKMGGEELNFSSDIDPIYIYEGDGYCRRDGRATEFSNVEFFSKVADTITRELSAESPEGEFVFRVDTRLRPEGDAGPRARSTVSMENYYATAGQTWERLALLKARPVAGDLEIGAELLEALQPFRYPRHPPPSLLAEIAAMKQRNQDAKGGGDGAFNVKLGAGGIREIEFIAQTLQLLHAGRFPFLQTHSTQTAFEQLVHYDIFPAEDADFLIDAYWFFRRVEHRIQMREEKQTHTLPAEADALAAIVQSLDFESTGAFLEKLRGTCERVHALYEDFFEPRERDEEFEDWWEFFTTAGVPEAVGEKIRLWQGAAARTDDFSGSLRIFVCGDASHLVTREQVMHFRHIAPKLDALMLTLARPALTLRRVARFASRYGSRTQFLNTCASGPHFLQALALLFDRSAYACDLLCDHPEIFEEVLRAGELQQRKDRAALADDIAAGPPGGGGEFARWLALYIRAEQLRYAIGELFGFLSTTDVEAALSLLADVVVERVLARLPGGDKLLVIALGKYGGGELTFGSDLDLMFVAADAADISNIAKSAQQLALLLRDEKGEPVLAIDARLRPHGVAGPFVTTVAALCAYHGMGGNAGPAAQIWERQMLTRARFVCGPEKLCAAFFAWRDELLFREPVNDAAVAEIRAMRARIERERDVVFPPERAFKTCAGGLVDFEFFAQIAQLREGWRRAELRTSSTRALLGELRVPRELAGNYDFLKRVEIAVRRDENKPVSILPEPGGEAMDALAVWLGFENGGAFWREHVARLAATGEWLAESRGR